MGVGTGGGISERSTGPGYGRCDAKIAIHSRRVVGVKEELKSGGPKQAWLQQRNTQECSLASQACEIRVGGTIREFVHSWANPPRRR
jgi:hypothetical protein